MTTAVAPATKTRRARLKTLARCRYTLASPKPSVLHYLSRKDGRVFFPYFYSLDASAITSKVMMDMSNK